MGLIRNLKLSRHFVYKKGSKAHNIYIILYWIWIWISNNNNNNFANEYERLTSTGK